jgi:Phosphomannose isomerase
MYGNYDKYPKIKSAGAVYAGYPSVARAFGLLEGGDRVAVFDLYPVVDRQEITGALGGCFDKIFVSDEAAYSGEELAARMEKWLTGDRVFGVLTEGELIDFFEPEKLEKMRSDIRAAKGKILVIGVGARLVTKGDLNIHFSIARWETELRFRRGAPNWNAENYNEDPLTKFKRGYFVEWRLADKHKVRYFDEFDFFVDTNTPGKPKAVRGKDYLSAVASTVKRPFRVVPYFDEGVWGGQWMKEACGLDGSVKNYAWCFDCVPEENSVYYDFGKTYFEAPAIDIVLTKGKELLGERVYERFGAEFPIRFDFLDTMGGGNLSLQVHPTKEYIKKTFNIAYTQDESYYILDAAEKSSVFLGLKEGVKKSEFINNLDNAQISGGIDVEKFVNKFPAKKHDHFLIPAGTVHCSGKDTMVLEISGTPYIFTFKMWDWGRLGLDGKPRPINIRHASEVIDFSRDTKWVKANLINNITPLEKTENYTSERTGLHELEFIETIRHRFTGDVLHKRNGSVNVINLVEGRECEVVSPDNSFEPFAIHYAETFIVPAAAGDFVIRPKGEGGLATIKAYVRENI